MSMIGGMFSGSKGTNFESSAAPISQVFDQTGALAGNNATAKAVQQQQDLVNALNAQNGLGNQSSVFNQLQGVANGTGPNPAQAMLNQSTGQNVANQAALMASQRGTGANPGMLARQAAMQGANIQQQAAGQGATMQANQRLGALGQLGGLANQQVANQIGGVQGLNSVTQGQEGLYNQGLANQNNAMVGMQSNQNNNNAAIANTNAQAQSGMVGGLMNGGGLSSLMGGGGGGGGGGGAAMMAMAKGGTIRKMYANGDIIAPPTGSVPMAGPQSALGQALIQPNLGQAAPMMALPDEDKWGKGGPGSDKNAKIAAPPQASNTDQQAVGNAANAQAQPAPQANPGILGGMLRDTFNLYNKIAGPSTTSSGPQGNSADESPLGGESTMSSGEGMAKGGKVPALVSPGERYLSPAEVRKVAEGKKPAIKAGEKIPGKPKVGGAKDDYANDTVRKTLEAGGVVLPRHVTQAKDPGKEAQKFVAAILAKQRLK